jgi:hypothetical protein
LGIVDTNSGFGVEQRRCFVVQEEWRWANILLSKVSIGFFSAQLMTLGQSTFVSFGMTYENLEPCPY